jgi:hypothetical protein
MPPVAAYCTTQDILVRLVGTPIDMSGTFRGALAGKIPEVCADINRRVATGRGQGAGWSFLADQAHEVQLASRAGNATDGTFTLSLGAITTADIDFDAVAADVEAALNTALGAATVTVAPAGAGGPWQITFTDEGPHDLLVAIADFTPAAAYVIVERLVPGVTVPTVRRYRGRNASILPIDDCVEVLAASLTRPDGSLIRPMVAGVDFLPVPLNGSPIVGLELVAGVWPAATIASVTLVPGYASSVPYDVREAAEIETIRSYFGDRTGQNDVLGMTPFGSLSVAKAFTSKVAQLVADYSYGGAMLRGAG